MTQDQPLQAAIVLLSGGLDSTVALAETLIRQPVALALTFDYGQRAAAREIAATRALCEHYQLNHRVIELPWIQALLPQALQPLLPQEAEEPSEDGRDVFDVRRVWVPNRNGLFLNIGACFAEALGVSTIVFGANAEEGAAFPDNTPEFRDRLNMALAMSTLSRVRVETPVGQLNKAEIIQRGLALQVPLHLVWSCYEGLEAQCGECASCLRVKEARQQVQARSGQSVEIAFRNG